MTRFPLLLAVLLSVPSAAHAQLTPPMPPADSPARHMVEGLRLPAPQTVPPGKLVRVTAECDGDVAFAVLSPAGSEPEYEIDGPGKRVLLVSPAAGQTLTILAVGQVDGKLTRFARTFVQSSGQPSPRPPPEPEPGPKPQPVAAAKFVTVLIDYSAGPAPPAYVSGASLRQQLQARGVSLTVLSATAEEVRRRRLDLAAKPAGDCRPSCSRTRRAGYWRPCGCRRMRRGSWRC